ncbi:major facilitator superfamily domain-containing protein [Circinella umbellata]|nr:major facilitator superfamily domain-containing protein [Circinella umbellata]
MQHSSNIAAWVHTSYLLVTVMTQLLYSKLSSLFGRQPMLVCVSAFFLIGSIGCSYATSFSQLLVSRVIAGLGGGGSSVMILTVLHDLLPPRERSQYQSYTYTAQMLGLVCGSPVGGFITEYFGWRICFKINIIPFLIVLYVFAFRLPNYDPPGNDHTPTTKKGHIFKKLYSIDFLGAILLGAANTTFTTGITLGGNTRSWTDPFILSMLGMSAVFFLIFGLYEMMGAAYPLVSRLVISSRNIISLCVGNHLWGLGTSVSFYVLPQLFMGVFGMNSAHTGLSIMVESLSISFASLCTGRYLRHQPHYRNFVLSTTIVYTLAIAVLSMWTSSGFPFVLGIICIIIEGCMSGAFVLSTLLAVGTEIPREDVSIVSSLAVMCRLMGYMNGVAIASAILQGTLKIYLYQHIQGDDIEQLLEFIRTSIRKVPTLSPKIQHIVADGLSLAIQRTFWFAIACTFATFLILFFFMEDNLLWSSTTSSITTADNNGNNNNNTNNNNVPTINKKR